MFDCVQNLVERLEVVRDVAVILKIKAVQKRKHIYFVPVYTTGRREWTESNGSLHKWKETVQIVLF